MYYILNELQRVNNTKYHFIFGIINKKRSLSYDRLLFFANLTKYYDRMMMLFSIRITS